jgi:hypothetical protein
MDGAAQMQFANKWLRGKEHKPVARQSKARQGTVRQGTASLALSCLVLRLALSCLASSVFRFCHFVCISWLKPHRIKGKVVCATRARKPM